MKRLKVLNVKVIFLFSMLTVLCFGLGSLSNADSVSFSVNGTNISFDTGNGADGDVEFRTDGMYVNGIKKVGPNTTETVLGNIFETLTTSKTYTTYYIESVVGYLPINRTYAPAANQFSGGAVAPTLGVVPNFNNLTIRAGVMLKGNIKALAFKVKGTLIVEGALSTAHGTGGVAGNSSNYIYNGGNGGDASGDIIIFSSTTQVAPNGSGASYGAVFAGWGGGGGGGNGSRYGNWSGAGGNGGKGSNVFLYTNNLVNNGEIRGGNGGGGGGGGAGWGGSGGQSGGQGGSGGTLKIFTNSLSNSSIIASGTNGATGTAGAYGGGAGGVGGYGSGGGGGGTYGAGGAGGSSGLDGYDGYKAYGGSTGGVSGTKSWSTWYTSVSCTPVQVYAKTVSLLGRLTAGYDLNTPGKGDIQLTFDSCSAINISNNYRNDISSNRTIRGISSTTLSSTVNISVLELNITNDVVLSSGIVSFSTFQVGGNVTINNGSSLSATTGTLSKNIVANSGSTISGVFTVTGTSTISANLGNLTLNSTGDVRFKDNFNYLNDSWWTGRTVTVNGLRIRGALPSAAPNAMGVNEVNLSDWTPKYNPSGTLPLMKFVIEKLEEGATIWVASSPIDKNLNSNVTWQDNGTVAQKTITYRVGFKNPSSSLGFIYIENITTSSKSEGGPGVGTTYMGQSAAYWAYQAATPVFRSVSGVGFVDCLYEKLVDTETTIDGVTLTPVTVPGTSFTYTKISGTFTNIDPNNPIKVVVVGGRVLLFKVIQPPTINDIATVTFGS